MPKGQTYTTEQIIEALRMVDEGVRVGDVCRQLGIVEKTFYRWREKYAGMEATEALRLRELEDQTARPRKQLAEQMFANEACVYRVYRSEGLTVRVKRRKRLLAAPRVSPLVRRTRQCSSSSSVKCRHAAGAPGGPSCA